MTALSARAAAAALIAIAALSAGGCSLGRDEAQSVTPLSTQLAALRGVPENGYTLGSASAPATLSIYAYVTTPGFARFVSDDLPAIVRDYVKPGRVKLELRTVSSATTDQDVIAAQLLQAAGLRDRLWPALLTFESTYAGALSDHDADVLLKAIKMPDRSEVLALRTNARVIGAIGRATQGAAKLKLRASAAYVLTTADGTTRTIAASDVVGGLGRALRG